MLAVFTMWPRQVGSCFAAASIMGVNRRTPCTTPQRFTPNTHSQSLTEFSQIRPPEPTPALLNTKCGAPKVFSTSAASGDAEAYGFKVYYGDGCRADVLHAAGAHTASAILVCLDNKGAATRIAELARTEFPQAELLVRAFDREHVLALRKADVGYLVRETFESAMAMGRQAVLTLGAAEEEADEVMERLRRRDAERMDMEAAGGLFAGRALVLGNQVKKAAAQQTAQDPA